MGFWSKLGKGLAIGGAGILTGMTGGAASPLLAATVAGARSKGGIKGYLKSAATGGASSYLSGLGGGGAASAAGGAAKSVGDTAKSSIMDTVGKYGKEIAPVLGGMSKERAAATQQNDLNSLSRDRNALGNYEAGLKAPGTRLRTSMGASEIANRQPVGVDWGGPGSGLAGKTVKFTGGYANPNLVSPDTKALAEDTMHQEMLSGMGGQGGPPEITPAHQDSLADNLIGYGSTAASILGAMNPGGQDATAAPTPAMGMGNHGYDQMIYPPAAKKPDPWGRVQF